MNETIVASQVRVVGLEEDISSIVGREEALQLAKDANLDLVEIVPDADPPVCRVMDYGRYKFEQKKKRQENRKRQKQVQVKEIKFRPGTDEGDYQVKLRNLLKFLKEGDRVKVTMRFRGREFAHKDRGLTFLKRVEDDLSSVGLVEQFPKMEGRQMIMLMAPKKTR
jgi:translation initiation factor IF-3